MNKRVDEFFAELKSNEKLRFKFYKLLKDYPQKEVVDKFSIEEQLKFICEVILPFAHSHGFEFNLADIVFDKGIDELGDLYLEEVSGGSNLGKRMTASTLAAISMLTFIPPTLALEKSQKSQSVTAIAQKDSKKSEIGYGNILDILGNNAEKLHPVSEDYPLNEVDCMILSTIAYLPSNFVPNLDIPDKDITIEEWSNRLFKYEKTRDEKLFFHREDEHTTGRYIKFGKNKEVGSIDASRKQLLKIAAKSPRYKNIKVGNFSGRYVPYSVGSTNSEQFAAVTFTLENGNKIVNFRGTDGTESGWKEDMDLSWDKKVLAQEHALEYLEKVFLLYPDSDFWISGHSKGGNLALYASFCFANESKEFLDRLSGVFNYDGPGLNEDIVKSIQPSVFDEVSNRLVAYIPQSSLVGRMMDYTSKCKVYCVNSSAENAVDILLQHDTLTWNVAYNYEQKGIENKFESSVLQPESQLMSDFTKLFVKSVDRENGMKVFVKWVFDFMVNNNISMSDSRGMNQICRDLFYNYFIKNKSVYDMVNIVFAPSTVIYLSEEDYRSFKDVLHSTFSSLLKAYWGIHVELNRKMGLSPELTKALEAMVKNDYELKDIYNVAKVVRDDVFTWENIKKFLMRIYGI